MRHSSRVAAIVHFTPQHPKRSNQRTLRLLPRLRRNRPKRALQRRPKNCKTTRVSDGDTAAARVRMRRRCYELHTLSHACVCTDFACVAAARERETSGDKTFLRTTKDESKPFTQKASARHNTVDKAAAGHDQWMHSCAAGFTTLTTDSTMIDTATAASEGDGARL